MTLDAFLRALSMPMPAWVQRLLDLHGPVKVRLNPSAGDRAACHLAMHGQVAFEAVRPSPEPEPALVILDEPYLMRAKGDHVGVDGWLDGFLEDGAIQLGTVPSWAPAPPAMTLDQLLESTREIRAQTRQTEAEACRLAARFEGVDETTLSAGARAGLEEARRIARAAFAPPAYTFRDLRPLVMAGEISDRATAFRLSLGERVFGPSLTRSLMHGFAQRRLVERLVREENEHFAALRLRLPPPPVPAVACRRAVTDPQEPVRTSWGSLRAGRTSLSSGVTPPDPSVAPRTPPR